MIQQNFICSQSLQKNQKNWIKGIALQKRLGNIITTFSHSEWIAGKRKCIISFFLPFFPQCIAHKRETFGDKSGTSLQDSHCMKVHLHPLAVVWVVGVTMDYSIYPPNSLTILNRDMARWCWSHYYSNKSKKEWSNALSFQKKTKVYCLWHP